MSQLLYSICNGGLHTELSLLQALSYCSILAFFYVISLYYFVPSYIHNRHRDDSVQIRWRASISSCVSFGAMLTYRPLFCNARSWTTNYDMIQLFDPSWARQTLIASSAVLLHTVILYFGPIATYFLLTYDALCRREGKVSLRRVLDSFLCTSIASFFRPLYSNDESLLWIFLRIQVFAPLTEEIVFRACMVPVLLSTGMTTANVCLIAPLFFGFAHFHHAFLRLRQGNSLLSVAITTFIQFCYTSIFGSYASYAFLRTGSLVAVVLCHSFCNAMGLPDVSFLQSNSLLYAYKGYLLASLIIGIALFVIALLFLEVPPNLVKF